MLQEVLKATKSRVLRSDIIFSKNVFKKKLLKFIRPEPNFTHNIHDYQRIKITYEIVAWIQSLK